MKKLGIGIVGYGGFGPFLHRAWADGRDHDVVMIADSNPARVPELPCAFTTDWHELIANPEVDIVAVVTPPSTHAELAVAALEAGKNVLVDKPIATTLSDAERIIHARDASGKAASVNFMLRFNPLVRQLAEWRRSGMLGALRHAAVENVAQDDTLPPNHWFWDREISGGILVEHAGHFMDLVDNVAGKRPHQVSGAHRMRNDSQEDQVLAIALYEDGLVATHYHEFSRPIALETTSIRLVFELAQVDLRGWIPIEGDITAQVNEQGFSALQTLPGWELTCSESIEKGAVLSAGKKYEVTQTVSGSFALPAPKLEVYADCLRASMGDLARAVRDPDHKVAVPLEDGISALDTALKASAAAQ